jgi:ribonuclease HI
MLPGKTDLPEDAWILNTDGAARGNPGPAGAGAVLRNAAGEIAAEIGKPLGVATNNEAEYMGLIVGLEAALEQKCQFISIRLDSELVVRQINGQYRVKNERLKSLYDRAMGLLHQFSGYDIFHVRRAENAEADALAANAADSCR